MPLINRDKFYGYVLAQNSLIQSFTLKSGKTIERLPDERVHFRQNHKQMEAIVSSAKGKQIYPNLASLLVRTPKQDESLRFNFKKKAIFYDTVKNATTKVEIRDTANNPVPLNENKPEKTDSAAAEIPALTPIVSENPKAPEETTKKVILQKQSEKTWPVQAEPTSSSLKADKVGISDPEGFSLNYAAIEPQLRRSAIALTRDETLAKDLCQETAIKMWRNRNSFKGESTVYTWAYRIMQNEFKNILKAQSAACRGKNAIHSEFNTSTGLVDEEFVLGSEYQQNTTYGQNPYNGIAAQEMLNHVSHTSTIKDGLSRLIAFEIYGYSYQELAERDQIPIGTVRSSISRARKEVNNNVSHRALALGYGT